MQRIVCIGNRLRAEDTFGPRVHDALARRGVPQHVELIDGGLAGLDLLWVFDDAEAVVLVDAAKGVAPAGRPVQLGMEEAAAPATDRFDHAAGVPYLLRVLLETCDGAPPRVRLVVCDGEADEDGIEAAADMCLDLLSRMKSAALTTAAQNAGSPA